MRLERLPPRVNVCRLDEALRRPSAEVLARHPRETGLEVQPARRRLTDGEWASGRAGGDRLPVAPLTDTAVLAAPTSGDQRTIVGCDLDWPQRLLGQADQGDVMGGAMHPHLGHLRQPAPKRLMERVERRNIRTGRPQVATDICAPTCPLPVGVGSVRTAAPGPNAIVISQVPIAGVPPRGATGGMGRHHRCLMVMEQGLRHPTPIRQGVPVPAHNGHHAT